MGRHQKKLGQKTKKNKKLLRVPFLALREGPLPRVPGPQHSGKPVFSPSVRIQHSGKSAFPECFFGSRGTIFLILSPNGAVCLGRHGTFSSPRAALPRVLRSGKVNFSECYSSPSVSLVTALGEVSLPRVQFFPETNTRERLASLSARFLALGEAFDTRKISILP